jgi:hypothetical protein
MPSEKEILLVFATYMQYAVGYDKTCGTDYQKAAEILLAFLQKHCSHPGIFLDYQLPSLLHFIKQVHEQPIDYKGFKYLVEQLLDLANKGELLDSRS